MRFWPEVPSVFISLIMNVSFLSSIWIKYKKKLLRSCIHYFKSDLIYSMDHMRLSGIQPSSVILSQRQVVEKIEKQCLKSAERSLSQKWCCNKPTKLQFLSILTQKILILSKRYKSTEVDRRTWLHVPAGTPLSTSSDNHKVVEI